MYVIEVIYGGKVNYVCEHNDYKIKAVSPTKSAALRLTKKQAQEMVEASSLPKDAEVKVMTEKQMLKKKGS